MQFENWNGWMVLSGLELPPDGGIKAELLMNEQQSGLELGDRIPRTSAGSFAPERPGLLELLCQLRRSAETGRTVSADYPVCGRRTCPFRFRT